MASSPAGSGSECVTGPRARAARSGIAGEPLPERWSDEARLRWQQVLDQARLSAERRTSSGSSEDAFRPVEGVGVRHAVPEPERAEDFVDTVPDASFVRRRRSAWTEEEMARLQAALDRVHARASSAELAPVVERPTRLAAPLKQSTQAAVPLGGRSWTEGERERVQAALAELRASRLATSSPVPSIGTAQTTGDSPSDGEGDAVVGAVALDQAAVSEVVAPSVTPEVSEDAVQPEEFDRLFGSIASQVDRTHPELDAPVLVEHAAGLVSAQEFSLQKPLAPERPRWYGPRDTVELHGLLIPGFVRVALDPQAKGLPLHPATIAAWMPADLGASTESVEPFQDFWSVPSYGSLTLAQRGLYLKWLASGRTFDVPARMALLFVHGLESRVVEEGPSALMEDERQAIAWAARDVVSRFGHALPQLREHGLNLAGFLDAANAPTRWYLGEVPELAESFDVAAPLQVVIGQAARDGVPLPAAWALASVLSDLRAPKRTPVGRCPEEMRELFSMQFEVAFPKGLKVPRRSSKTLKVVYRGVSDPGTGMPASASLVVPSADQAWLGQDQVETLLQAVDQCADELSTYSRFIGRMPTAKGTPDAVVRLPPRLLQRRLAANLKELSASAGQRKQVSLDQAWMALWGTLPERKDSAPYLRALLEAAGLTVVATVPAASQRTSDSSAAGQPFRLDPERLEKVRRDEAASTKLLSALFAETSEQAPPESLPPVHVDPARALFPQLDDDHFQFLTTLLQAEYWNRERLQDVAGQLGLMLDGALEVMNDAAFELAGAPLVVDDGDLELDAEIAREMTAAMAAARQADG